MRVRVTGALVALMIASFLTNLGASTIESGPPIGSPAAPRQTQLPLAPGTSSECTDRITRANVLLTVLLPIIGWPTLILDFFADEGWVWVEPNGRRIQALSGRVTGPTIHNLDINPPGVPAPDSYANHESHDFIFNVKVDGGQEYLLSPVSADSDGDGNPDTIHIEWETGISPAAKTGDGSSPIFPKWAWPSVGDRVWVEGHWVYDCGHEEEDDGGDDFYYTEIHPARAVATMREQAGTLPGSGTTPVPITKTDVYIHGIGGYVVDQLNCGIDIVYDPFANCPVKTTPIDSDVTFNVCLPRRPINGIFSSRHEPGPRNTVSIDPHVEKVPAAGACTLDTRFDHTWMAQVSIPLGGSEIEPDAVYARHIYAGWITAPNPVLEHRRVTLTSMDLYKDHDELGSGELTFMWANIDRAKLPWIRLADYAEGMNDVDSGESTSFFGAAFDFYLRNDDEYTIRSVGMDQDCMDDYFGVHYLTPLIYLNCFASFLEPGRNDQLDPPRPKALVAGSLGIQFTTGDDYKLWFDVEEVPIDKEDTADLSIATSCTFPGEVALVDKPITCSSKAANTGPGLPRSTTMTSAFSGTTAAAVVDTGTWTVGPLLDELDHKCDSGGPTASCNLRTVQTGGSANIVITATPTSAGLLTQQVSVNTASTDPVGSNNSASATIDVFLGVTVDVSPRTEINEINLGRGGSVTVAILTTDAFDAASVDPLTVCFGDAEAPTQRSCTEEHGEGHLNDVNRDHRPDLVLHFEVGATGIDPGDTNACLIGRTRDGIGVYGCNAIVTR